MLMLALRLFCVLFLLQDSRALVHNQDDDRGCRLCFGVCVEDEERGQKARR